MEQARKAEREGEREQRLRLFSLMSLHLVAFVERGIGEKKKRKKYGIQHKIASLVSLRIKAFQTVTSRLLSVR